MATRLDISKTGIRLVCEVSAHPRPRPRGAWPVPDFPPAAGNSMLSVTLEAIPGASRKGIRVTSAPEKLPGGSDAVWSLHHAAYQGDAPETLPWVSQTVSAPKFSLLIPDPMPKAFHRFRLRRVEGGQTVDYPEATIATPDDPWMPLSLEGILVDDLISAAEKAAFKAYYDAIIAEQASLDALADQWLCSRTAYDAALSALTAAVLALSPAYTDLTHDTALGTGGGAVLLSLFQTAYSTRDALKAAIQVAIGGGAGDVWEDNKLTPGEKRLVYRWYTDLIAEQGGANGLDAQADTAGVSRVAYDASLSALTSYLATLTGTGGWSNSTKNWTDYTTTYNLGAGGGAVGRGKFVDAYSARMALILAIQSAALDPGEAPEDFRPVHRWDFGPTTPSGVTVTYCTESTSPSPDDTTARRFTSSSQSGPMLTFDIPRLRAGREVYVLLARVRLVSGTWYGRATYQSSGHGFSDSYRKDVAAPTVGEWRLVAWDMKSLTAGTTDYINAAEIQKIRLQLGNNSAVVDVDWVAAGIYSAGSSLDYDQALQDAVTALLAKGNVTVLANLIVGNISNLWPNPDSELTGLATDDIGAVALDMASGQAWKGVGCRKLLAGQTVRPTLKTQANEGDAYYFSFRGKVLTGQLRVRFEAFNAAGGSLGYCDPAAGFLTTATAYEEVAGFFTVPASATSIQAVMDATGTSYGDAFVLRKAADGKLIVPGSIESHHLKTTFAESWFLRVGPWYRFRTADAGNYLEPQDDGGFKRPSTGEIPNAADATYYCDASRVHPGRPSMVYGASFWGSIWAQRSILVGLGSPWATSGLTGYELRRDPANARFGLFRVYGVGNYGAAPLSGWQTLTAVTSADPERIKLKIFNPSSVSSSTVRLSVYIDGVLRKSYTQSEMGSPSGAIGGYASLRLADTALRCGMLAMGPGNVVIEGGTVEADVLESDLAVAGVVRSPNYSAGGTGVAPTGYKLSGSEFTTTFKDGTTDTHCHLELEGSANIAGYKAMTMADRVFNSCAASSNLSNTYSTTDSVNHRHCGLALYFTPRSSGNVIIRMSGTLLNDNAGRGVLRLMMYGTGTAPSAGAIATGTRIGPNRTVYSTAVAAHVGFTSEVIVTGLTPGVTYWADLVICTTPGGTAKLYDGVDFVAQEV